MLMRRSLFDFPLRLQFHDGTVLRWPSPLLDDTGSWKHHEGSESAADVPKSLAQSSL